LNPGLDVSGAAPYCATHFQKHGKPERGGAPLAGRTIQEVFRDVTVKREIRIPSDGSFEGFLCRVVGLWVCVLCLVDGLHRPNDFVVQSRDDLRPDTLKLLAD